VLAGPPAAFTAATADHFGGSVTAMSDAWVTVCRAGLLATSQRSLLTADSAFPISRWAGRLACGKTCGSRSDA